tara:strand:- start:267 stop:491 length:225 start_codon:yes stop_codon:yes gene_type:complete
MNLSIYENINQKTLLLNLFLKDYYMENNKEDIAIDKLINIVEEKKEKKKRKKTIAQLFDIKKFKNKYVQIINKK